VDGEIEVPRGKGRLPGGLIRHTSFWMVSVRYVWWLLRRCFGFCETVSIVACTNSDGVEKKELCLPAGQAAFIWLDNELTYFSCSSTRSNCSDGDFRGVAHFIRFQGPNSTCPDTQGYSFK